ncbi:hypothetical protein DENSPDRAFT_886212 [Dentipellis sp. KUC8613]|nr:hypothetical protein DENSPDRAFT_886212 [Dentipellis sp. KUC8613]
MPTHHSSRIACTSSSPPPAHFRPNLLLGQSPSHTRSSSLTPPLALQSHVLRPPHLARPPCLAHPPYLAHHRAAVLTRSRRISPPCVACPRPHVHDALFPVSPLDPAPLPPSPAPPPPSHRVMSALDAAPRPSNALWRPTMLPCDPAGAVSCPTPHPTDAVSNAALRPSDASPRPSDALWPSVPPFSRPVGRLAPRTAVVVSCRALSRGVTHSQHPVPPSSCLVPRPVPPSARPAASSHTLPPSFPPSSRPAPLSAGCWRPLDLYPAVFAPTTSAHARARPSSRRCHALFSLRHAPRAPSDALSRPAAHDRLLPRALNPATPSSRASGFVAHSQPPGTPSSYTVSRPTPCRPFCIPLHRQRPTTRSLGPMGPSAPHTAACAAAAPYSGPAAPSAPSAPHTAVFVPNSAFCVPPRAVLTPRHTVFGPHRAASTPRPAVCAPRCLHAPPLPLNAPRGRLVPTIMSALAPHHAFLPRSHAPQHRCRAPAAPSPAVTRRRSIPGVLARRPDAPKCYPRALKRRHASLRRPFKPLGLQQGALAPPSLATLVLPLPAIALSSRAVVPPHSPPPVLTPPSPAPCRRHPPRVAIARPSPALASHAHAAASGGCNASNARKSKCLL